MGAKVPGGWSMDRTPFSQVAREVLAAMLNARRLGLRLADDAERGMRFNDDNAILARLESMFTEGEFMACPGLRIDSALTDAAQSDYWYNHEKDYGDDETPETEIAEDEDNE